MNWFKKILPSRIKTDGNGRRTVPEGVWTKCQDCGAVLYREELDKNLEVCPKCNHHMKIAARSRLQYFLDEEYKKEIGINIKPIDVLKFRDTKRYKDRLSQAKKNTGENDAIVVMSGNLKGLPVVVCAFEFGFMGGSMGSVVGEKFVLGVEKAIEKTKPGNTAHDVAEAFWDVLNKYGLEKDSRCGYSIGIGYPPDWGEHTLSIRKNDMTILQPNVTFHLMAGMWMDTWGIEMSESIRVTDKGCELFCNLSRDLYLI